MPNQEIWGPAVWVMFHTLSEQMTEDIFSKCGMSLVSLFIQVCGMLPCPECAGHAREYLAKSRIRSVRTRAEFRHFLWTFHNTVNMRKRKPRLDESKLTELFSHHSIGHAIHAFISTFHTNGNMNQLAESFHRKQLVQRVIQWTRTNAQLFNNKIYNTI